MNKIFKLLKITFVSMLLVSSLYSFVLGRTIGEFEDFPVKTYGWASTSLQPKSHNDEYYVINLNETKIGEKIRHCIVNMDGERRSPIEKVSTGSRDTNSTWAKAGYDYALEMQRYGYEPITVHVYGSWSPDYRD